MNKLKKSGEIDFLSNDTIKQIINALIITLVISDTVLIGFILLYLSYSNSVYIIGFDLVVCIVLFAEFVSNRLKGEKSSLKENLIDILAVAPLLFFTLLPASWAGYLAFVRLFRVVVLIEKGKKNIFNFVRKTKLSYIFLTLLIIICASSIAMLVLESSPVDKINDPLNAI